MANQTPAKSDKPIRWWLLAAIVTLTLLGILVIRIVDESHRQRQLSRMADVLGISVLLMLIWLLLFSRLRWKIRLTALGTLLLLVASCFAMFRIDGFSGDYVPIVEWRWAKRASKAVQTSPTLEVKLDARHSYPQFLGPHRNATLNGVNLARNWSERPPKQIWRQSIGEGWSAFAIKGNFAVTQEQRDEQEMVTCYDLMSGALNWKHGDKARQERVPGGIGPRATPTIAGEQVFTLGTSGILNCLDLATGQRRWSRSIIADNKGTVKDFGVSCSPLVVDNMIIVSAGGRRGRSLVAYDRHTGKRVWRGGSDTAGYSSPLITTIAGARQILIFNRGNVVAHEPATGKVLWQHPWPTGTQYVAQPVPLPGDRVFVSSGYGVGCKLFQIERNRQSNLHASLIWETRDLKAKFTNVVHKDGYIYGLDDGILVCLDLNNGRRRWKRGRYGHGQLILIDDLLLIQAESGDIVLVEANPEAHKEVDRLPALNRRTWNNPAFANPYLLVRNDREAVCYELPLKNGD